MIDLEGRRVPDGTPPSELRPGDFSKHAEADDFGGFWIVCDPAGAAYSIGPPSYHVIDHDDGGITVRPAIVGPGGWQGWLTTGVWTAC